MNIYLNEHLEEPLPRRYPCAWFQKCCRTTPKPILDFRKCFPFYQVTHSECGLANTWHDIVKRDLLQVEGLLREFQGEVPRTEEGLLKEIRRVFLVNGIDTKENIQKTMDGFVDNAIFQKGNSLLKANQEDHLAGTWL